MSEPFNPPAFPCEAQGDRSVPPEHDYIQTGIHSSKFPGMTLRDYFAGQALTGLMAAGEGDGATTYAFFLADKMLAAREQGK